MQKLLSRSWTIDKDIECLTFEDISPAAILTNVKSQNLEHLLIGGCSFKKDCTLLNQGKKYPLKNFILNNEHYNPEQERDDCNYPAFVPKLILSEIASNQRKDKGYLDSPLTIAVLHSS